MGLNSFGFGGTNAHICLRSPPTPRKYEQPIGQMTAMPRLVCYSSRTEDGLMTALTAAEHAVLESPDLLTLLSIQCHQPTTLCPFRGYSINAMVGDPKPPPIRHFTVCACKRGSYCAVVLNRSRPWHRTRVQCGLFIRAWAHSGRRWGGS
jgi:hypothetical protein